MTDADLMEPEEFAARIGETRVWVMRNYQDIPHRRIGRRIKFHEDDYRAYLELIKREPRPMTTRRKNRK